MIRKFIGKLIEKAAGKSGGKKTRLGKRVEIGAQVHGIDPALLDESAVDVVRTLRAAGYEAYIVGGAVRDLLLGLKPKDFDVATNATPEEVKKLFRRAYIVGRRFRIVHVVFGRWRAKARAIIEVSTFRAWIDGAEAERIAADERSARQLAGVRHAVDASGRVLRDNVWGPQIEDAARRDFSVNAMYYEPESRILVDYHGGMADARALPAHDWRAGCALPRRPRAHPARRALCRKTERARLHARRRHRAPAQKEPAAALRRAAQPHV